MACGCNKSKNSAQANAQRAARVNRVVFRPTPVVEGLAPTHAKTGNRYSPTTYLVALREDLASGNVESAEKLNTLAEAQKRLRDLGSAYGVKAVRF